ncbi:MAG: cupredoxin domain-containing protein [Bryobacterales bacterium]|nr:cupredoxin domain-containing protein [Bryobacterales bacterium]
MKLLTVTLLGYALLAAQGDGGRKPDRVISIAAERFAFNPSKITLKQGDLVEFVLTSDDTDHGFRIPSAGIDLAIPPQSRGEARVRFIAKEKGEFAFECSRPCGAGHNLMRGIIEVK